MQFDLRAEQCSVVAPRAPEWITRLRCSSCVQNLYQDNLFCSSCGGKVAHFHSSRWSVASVTATCSRTLPPAELQLLLGIQTRRPQRSVWWHKNPLTLGFNPRIILLKFYQVLPSCQFSFDLLSSMSCSTPAHRSPNSRIMLSVWPFVLPSQQSPGRKPLSGLCS